MGNSGTVIVHPNASCFIRLRHLIETQSKLTICNWCINYAEKKILPIFEERYPGDLRLRHDIDLAYGWLAKKNKFPQIRREFKAHIAAKEVCDDPVAQAAAHAIVQATFTIHVPMHALRFAFFGATATAYHKVGEGQPQRVYDCLTEAFCADYENALLAIAVEIEPNPANINWKNWLHI